MSDYKRNPRGARRARKSMGRKALVVLSLMMVLAVAAVGGTLAWLTDSTQEVKNTFTTSDIEITLTESENLDLKMVPGFTITKDVPGGALAIARERQRNLGGWVETRKAEGKL